MLAPVPRALRTATTSRALRRPLLHRALSIGRSRQSPDKSTQSTPPVNSADNVPIRHIKTGKQPKNRKQNAPILPRRPIIRFPRPANASEDLYDKFKSTDPLWLRDACDCHLCVDKSTKQKTFQTTDIPSSLSVATAEFLPEEEHKGQPLKVTWNSDLPSLEEKDHVSLYSREFLARNQLITWPVEPPALFYPELWDKSVMTEKISFIDYREYMNELPTLSRLLEQLKLYGIVFLQNVPEEVDAVKNIAERIGRLRDTFYGETWDVKSVPDAKNVAYTSVELGFHMDLLYMSHPPDFQLLHCLKNSCEGGESLFSDTFRAARHVRDKDNRTYRDLHVYKLQYHYRNDGHHFSRARAPFVSVVKRRNSGATTMLEEVNWSPPFQAPWERISQPRHASDDGFGEMLQGLRMFAENMEREENVYEYKMKEGDCVLFDNRRVVHARKAFDVGSGERWLRGAYLDRDVVESRMRRVDYMIKESQSGRTEEGVEKWAFMPSDGLEPGPDS